MALPTKIPVKSSITDTDIHGVQPTTRTRIVELEAWRWLYIRSAPIGHIEDGMVSRFVYQDDMRVCSECGKVWPATYYYFHPNSNRQDGLDSICRHCAAAPGQQRCNRCGQYHPLEERFWHRDSHSPTGFRTVCKHCRNH